MSFSGGGRGVFLELLGYISVRDQAPLLKIENLFFSYGKARPILDNLDLELWADQTVGLVGANGSGKTTLFRCLTGLEKIGSGIIRLNGKKVATERDFALLRRQVGYLLQNSDDQLIFPGVLEDVAFGPLNLGFSADMANAIGRECLALVGLDGFEDRLTHELSGGEKKLAALAGILAMRPVAVLLDEPLNELDEMAQERIGDILAGLSCAKLIISHDGHFLRRICNGIVRLEKGHLRWIS